MIINGINFDRVTPWVETEDGCGAFRHLEGSNPNNIETRVAFIEKTPRVRIRSANNNGQWEDFLNWAAGYKGSGIHDPESRKWCDDMLKLLGYEGV